MCVMASESEVRLLDFKNSDAIRGVAWNLSDVHEKLGSGGEHVTFSATHVYVLLNPQTSPFTLYKFNNSTLVLESVHQIGQVDSLDLQTSFSF